jgi:hypothetical protein
MTTRIATILSVIAISLIFFIAVEVGIALLVSWVNPIDTLTLAAYILSLVMPVFASIFFYYLKSRRRLIVLSIVMLLLLSIDVLLIMFVNRAFF